MIDSSSDEGRKLEEAKGDIEFKDVNFAYPTRLENTVFCRFSLKIEAGQTVALVGSSGGGKSVNNGLRSLRPSQSILNA